MRARAPDRGRSGAGVEGGHQAPHGGHAAGRYPDALSVLPDGRLVGREIDAVDLVLGDVALDPLDLRARAR
jgi:hypothetical protein